MFFITSCRIVYRAATQWSANGDTRLGAALAYYALFSIAPLLVIAIQVAGAVFGEDAAKGKVHEQLVNLTVDEANATAIEDLVANATKPTDSTWTTAFSLGLLVIGALGGFLHVRGALCTIWKLAPPHGNSWLGLIWDYTLALVMVFLISILLLVSVAASLVIPILKKEMAQHGVDLESYWQWVELGISFFSLTLLFATSYRILSGGRVSWSYVWYGSLIAAVLFTLGKTLFGYYLVYSGTASVYGAAGSLVVFLMWVYYSSQTLFFGAELIQARRTRREWMNGDTKTG